MMRATEGGILVEPESAEALAVGIMELLNDVGQREHLGKTGQINVHQKFNDEVVAEQLLKVFQNYT
jgi:glycosyltransferase involved in cell wall biosynthesis